MTPMQEPSLLRYYKHDVIYWQPLQPWQLKQQLLCPCKFHHHLWLPLVVHWQVACLEEGAVACLAVGRNKLIPREKSKGWWVYSPIKLISIKFWWTKIETKKPWSVRGWVPSRCQWRGLIRHWGLHQKMMVLQASIPLVEVQNAIAQISYRT